MACHAPPTAPTDSMSGDDGSNEAWTWARGLQPHHFWVLDANEELHDPRDYRDELGDPPYQGDTPKGWRWLACAMCHEKIGYLNKRMKFKDTASLNMHNWTVHRPSSQAQGSDTKAKVSFYAPEPMSAAPESACRPGESHPPSSRRSGVRKYWLFAAAGQGCRECVAYYLEKEMVHPMSESENNHYTVRDWALWAKKQGKPGADDLLAYLENWPMIPAASAPERGRDKRHRADTSLEAGLATPLTDGRGAKIMGRMGWSPGETLGASGRGMAEPLKPDLTHLGNSSQGLGYGN